MNLQRLSDTELHASSQNAAAAERASTLNLLKHLSEIERRHLFSKYACDSLHAYCVKYLKMSDPQAGRRVAASRLLREIPALEEKVQTGSLTLTSVCQASSFFKAEAKAGNRFAPDAKSELLDKLDNQSKVKVEQILMAHSSAIEVHVRETVKQRTETLVEIKIIADAEFLADLNRLKEIWSHALPGANYTELIKRIAKNELKRVDPDLKAARAHERALAKTDEVAEKKWASSTATANGESGIGSCSAASSERTSNRSVQRDVPTPAESQSEILQWPSEVAAAEQPTTRSRQIPTAVQHAVRLRAGGCCTFVNDETGECCGSRSFLEFDHIIPFATGGENSVENLRLRCRAHNQRHAIESFGHAGAKKWRTRGAPGSHVRCARLAYG